MSEYRTLCIHLADGMTIIAKESTVDHNAIGVRDPLVLSKYKSDEDSVQLILTKYDTFNTAKDVEIKIFNSGIVSFYVIDEKIKDFYEKFVETYAESPPEVRSVGVASSPKEAAKFLTEAANKSKASKTTPKGINIEELRKETVKLKLVTNDGLEVDED